MEKRNYTHVQRLLPEIEGMPSAGKTQREVSEHFGFKDKYVAKRLLNREREKQRKLAAGNVPGPQGRPRKDTQPRDMAAEQAHEIERLGMENRLLRIFCNPLGRC